MPGTSRKLLLQKDGVSGPSHQEAVAEQLFRPEAGLPGQVPNQRQSVEGSETRETAPQGSLWFAEIDSLEEARPGSLQFIDRLHKLFRKL